MFFLNLSFPEFVAILGSVSAVLVTLYLLDREVSENFLILGDEVLIGQTALEATDLLVDCGRQRVTTNPDHPNAPVIRIR